MTLGSDIEGVQGESLDALIAELDRAHDRLPANAICKLRQRRDEAIPKLIESIRCATASARQGQVPHANAHFYALYLLAEFHALDALPAIIEAVSLPGELPFDLFGDAITESLQSVLAALASDPHKQLDPVIADPTINQYVRWEAVDAYCLLVRDGRVSRDDAVQTSLSHLRNAMASDDDEIVGPLVSLLTDLGPREALAEIRAAFDRDLIEPIFMRYEHVERAVADGDRHYRACLASYAPSGIADTIAELQRWCAFQDRPDRQESSSNEWDDRADEAQEPFVSTVPRVGRNDPCPCGSGKKFKKCCGSCTQPR
jgi:hypothetical protein